jgi:hypothetical protein
LYAAPKDLRSQLLENNAYGVALIRLSVIAAAISATYLITIAFNPNLALRYAAFSIGVFVIARISYLIGVYDNLTYMTLFQTLLVPPAAR